MRQLLFQITAARVAFALLLAQTGCAMHSTAVHRPQNRAVDAALTVSWTDAVESRAQSGDLVFRRGYAAISDVISFVSEGDDLTHVAVIDAERGTVIEAVEGGVREVPLARFVDGAHRVVLVRPAHIDAAARRRVLERARSQVGAPYDYSGFIGIDTPGKFYCTELAAWAIAQEQETHFGALVEPGELMALGTVLYDSGER
jgi:cell wall-associated NlpC family hydrolase